MTMFVIGQVDRRTVFLAVLVALCLGCTGGSPDTALRRAIQAGNETAVLKLLKDNSVQVNAPDFKGITPLLQALLSGKKSIYSALLEHGANPNLCDRTGRCVMNESAEAADSFWLREAIAHDGDPDVLNVGNPYYRWTPLFYAITKHRRENAALLIKAGADVDYVDGHDIVPLIHALESNQYDIVVELLEADANPEKPNKMGITFLSYFKSGMKFGADKDQLPWFQKTKELLSKRGLLNAEPMDE